MAPIPILFYIGNVPVYSHGFFLLFGLLAGLGWLLIEAKRRRWSKEEVIPITLAAFVGGMMGARISILFFNGFEYAPVVLDMYAMFDPRIGPGSIIGGVVGAYIGGYIASKAIGKDKCSCDAFAPAMALATAIGRIGCFLSFEDALGKPTNLPWGVYVPAEYGGGYLAHPAPLYDMMFNLVWFGILIALRDHKWMQNGNLLKVGIGGYAFFRFFVEFVRNNHMLVFGLTGQQLVSALLFIGVVAYFLRQSERQPQPLPA
jgi:phosphatidylglycerol---prolipoprotein diacylglyceryl transferase